VTGTITNDDAPAALPAATTVWAFNSGGNGSPPFDVRALPGYGVATSAVFYFSEGGWAGWSVPAGKVVLGAKIISAGDTLADFAVFKAAGPDEVFPHYAYGPAESGWVLQAKQANVGVQIEVYYADPPTVTVQVAPSSVANTVQVAQPSVAEDGPQKLTYTFTATGPLTRNITVAYEIGGSATAGRDFTGIPMGASTGAITIPANSSAPGSAATLTITPTPDTVVEPDETVVITLKNGTGYGLGTDRVATGTIENDDFEVDLDVDSDNTGNLDRTPGEDDIEEATDGQGMIVRPGVIVPVGPERTKMIAEVPAGMTATLEFDAAAAKKVKVFLPSGAVALDTATLKTTVVGGEPQTFWIEASAPSAILADIAFTLTLVVGTGSGSAGSPPSDMIRATAVAVDLDVDSNNDGAIDPDNGPAGTDDPIEDDPESPGVRVPVQGQRSEMRLGSHATQPTASRLQIDSGAGNVELWDAPTGGTRLTLDAEAGISWAAGQRPAAVWIQAIRPSDEVGDIRFTLTDSFGTSSTPITDSDTVRATAMAEVMLFFHFDTQTALDELEDSLPPPAVIDQTGMLVLTPADSAALQARRAAWLAGHLATPTVAGTVKSFAELQNAVTAAEGKLTSARAAAAAMTSMRGQPSQHTSQQYLSAVESALYAHDEYLHAVQMAQKVQANFLADQSWISSRDEALLQRFFALPVRIDGLEADITPEQWQGLTDSFEGVRASLDRLDDNLGRVAGGVRATRDVLAGGVIAVGAVYVLPVSVAVYAGGTILAGGAILSGAKRWDAGQSELEVVFGAAADTAGVTSFSLGLWGTDPVTGQEVALTPEDGAYELIVGASSISMLVGMPFANGLRGPTTGIPVPKAQVQFVESFSVVGDRVIASPVRVPVVTWTKGAIEVSHQGVAIASAYAGTTRIVAMMASGPMPNGAPTPSRRSQERIDFLPHKRTGMILGICPDRRLRRDGRPGAVGVPFPAPEGGHRRSETAAPGCRIRAARGILPRCNTPPPARPWTSPPCRPTSVTAPGSSGSTRATTPSSSRREPWSPGC
jgi:hypothetical protein